VFPVSAAGREIATFIIVVGMGNFGTFSGYLANVFLARKEPPAAAVMFTDDDTRHELTSSRTYWTNNRSRSRKSSLRLTGTEPGLASRPAFRRDGSFIPAG
jgi:hypothetical protein